MYERSHSRVAARRSGRAWLLTALTVATACGEVTAPKTISDEPEPQEIELVEATVPTGQLLVERGGDIVLVSATDGQPVVVAKNARLPSWSPDGSMIAFVRDEEPSTAGIGSSTLCVTKLDGSDTRCASEALVVVGATASSLYTPVSWSPDGTRLAYSGYGFSSNGVGNPSGLRVLDLATMTYQELTDFPVSSPSWSPDGKRIALVYHGGEASENDEPGSLAVIAPDGTGFQKVRGGDSRYVFMEVKWSPSGEALAFGVADQWNCPMGCASALAVAKFAGDSSGGTISSFRVIADRWVHGGFTWSPDETEVAFPRLTCRHGGGCTSTVISAAVEGSPSSLMIPSAQYPAWGR